MALHAIFPHLRGKLHLTCLLVIQDATEGQHQTSVVSIIKVMVGFSLY